VKEPVWIEAHDATVLHERLLAAHGGAAGIRDEALLESALSRPRHHFAYAAKVDVVEMASVYTAGIVRNHPFIDGNKRTGFVVGVLFLELNGYRFTASEEEALQFVLDLAAGRLDEAAYAAFLRQHVGAE
jgi:death-on-curing protein